MAQYDAPSADLIQCNWEILNLQLHWSTAFFAQLWIVRKWVFLPPYSESFIVIFCEAELMSWTVFVKRVHSPDWGLPWNGSNAHQFEFDVERPSLQENNCSFKVGGNLHLDPQPISGVCFCSNLCTIAHIATSGSVTTCVAIRYGMIYTSKYARLFHNVWIFRMYCNRHTAEPFIVPLV